MGLDIMLQTLHNTGHFCANATHYILGKIGIQNVYNKSIYVRNNGNHPHFSI